jgi:hypothetical protein
MQESPSVLSPEWTAETLATYTAPKNGENCHTISFRYPYLDDDIRKIVGNLPSNPNILYVGVGRSRYNGEEKAASGCFELASILQSLDKDYRMTLLDTDWDTLEKAMNQETISFPEIQVNDPRNSILQNYLNDTMQKVWKNGDSGHITNYVSVPESFSAKRISGDIKQLKADIVKDKIAYGPYDFIHCLSVIPHIKDSSFKLVALHNLSSSLKKGGHMLIEHENSTLPERQPSMTLGLITDYCARLNLAFEEMINKRKSVSYLLLRKEDNISSAASLLSKLS